jgi:hypothetical protein
MVVTLCSVSAHVDFITSISAPTEVDAANGPGRVYGYQLPYILILAGSAAAT